jgi:hypothetical protein
VTPSGLLEPCAVKVASTVLRGDRRSNAAVLPDSFDSSCWRQTPAASKEARPQWRSHAVSTFDEQNWAVSVSAISTTR